MNQSDKSETERATAEWCDACKAAEAQLVSASGLYVIWPRRSSDCSRWTNCRTLIRDSVAEVITEWERATGRQWQEGHG